MGTISLQNSIQAHSPLVHVLWSESRIWAPHVFSRRPFLFSRSPQDVRPVRDTFRNNTSSAFDRSATNQVLSTSMPKMEQFGWSRVCQDGFHDYLPLISCFTKGGPVQFPEYTWFNVQKNSPSYTGVSEVIMTSTGEGMSEKINNNNKI